MGEDMQGLRNEFQHLWRNPNSPQNISFLDEPVIIGAGFEGEKLKAVVIKTGTDRIVVRIGSRIYYNSLDAVLKFSFNDP